MAVSENMHPVLDPANRDRLLAHLGLDAPPEADHAGLVALQRAWLARIPFEALAAQLGEYQPLDTARLVDRFVEQRRGGYCFEVNGVFALLLESLGYTVDRHEAVVGARDLYRSGAPPDHLALVAHTPEGRFIAEVGFGDGPLDPLPLAAGTTTFPHETFEVAREGEGWWVGQGHPAEIGYRFGDRVVDLAAFAPHHERMATSQESGFVRTLVLFRFNADGVAGLRGRVLRHGGEERVLADAADLEAVLSERFGIDTAVLGPERLARLWDGAVAQHEAFLART